MTLDVPHGEPYAGKLHVRFDEGADVPDEGRPALLYTPPRACKIRVSEMDAPYRGGFAVLLRCFWHNSFRSGGLSRRSVLRSRKGPSEERKERDYGKDKANQSDRGPH